MKAKRQSVYLVMAYTCYEGSEPVRAFLSSDDAMAFAAKCKAHTARAPQGPEVLENTPESLAEHEAWSERNERWVKRHPAGAMNACCDDFPVVKIPLVMA